MITTKYLYVSQSKQYGKLTTRMTSTKGNVKKNEICLKLNIDVPKEAFIDSTPQVDIEIPNDYKKRTINLRVS